MDQNQQLSSHQEEFLRGFTGLSLGMGGGVLQGMGSGGMPGLPHMPQQQPYAGFMVSRGCRNECVPEGTRRPWINLVPVPIGSLVNSDDRELLVGGCAAPCRSRLLYLSLLSFSRDGNRTTFTRLAFPFPPSVSTITLYSP